MDSFAPPRNGTTHPVASWLMVATYFTQYPVTFPPRTSNTSRSKQACLPARTFVKSGTVVAFASVFAWDPHVIPQYGADAADAEVLTDAVEAAATGVIP